MKIPAHLYGLYNRAARRYRKLSSRLRKETDTSGFRYRSLLNALRKLRRKIGQLQLQLRLATATGALVLSVSFHSAQAQTTTNGPFVPQPRHLNPLREPFKFDGTTYPAIVDLDKDGDFDLVVGDEGQYYYSYNGNYSTIQPLRYLVNIGTNALPVFEERKGEENPFNDLFILNRNRGPVFADIDQDGDDDLFVGLRDWNAGRILYFKNDDGVFTEQTTSWDPAAKTGNPFLNIAVTGNIKLAFTDLDNDTDLDAIVTGQMYDYATGAQRYINYFKNDGSGNFADASSEVSFTPEPTNWDLNPAFADVDKDGDQDLVLGGYYLGLRYYKQVTPGNFVEETGAFDPVAGTGNPFDGIYEPNTQPVFADLDNDADADLLLGDGDGDHYYPLPNNIIHYFKNSGTGVFTVQPDLANALGGVDVRRVASPVLIDLDGDDDLDALIGNKYEDYYLGYNLPAYYNYHDGMFTRKLDEENPFSDVGVNGPFTPEIVDIDADGDLDIISGDYYGQVRLFRNDGTNYVLEGTGSPFEGIDIGNRTSPELADLDGDGDLDLILSSSYDVRYFENTGDAQVPVFEEQTGTVNPFYGLHEYNYVGFLDLADVDHDGDLDLLSSEAVYFKYYGFNQIVYYENTGGPDAPLFSLADTQPFATGEIPLDFYASYRLQPFLADQDGDGDLDLFVGNYLGHIRYVKNENPSVAANIAATPLNYRVGVDESVQIDPALTLSDEDNDLVMQATARITNYQEGDELHFVAQAGITGSFDASLGILTFTGKETLAAYQDVLRSVTYHYHDDDDGGRKRPQKRQTVSKGVEFSIFDSDFTDPQVATRTVNVIFNSPPVLENTTQVTQFGNSVSIDLETLMSDPDDNLDLSTLKIVQQPVSGATALIDGNNHLVIDYDGINFTGTDNLIIEVCDALGECTQNLITIEVQNSGQIEVFNAVAPNSSGDNRFMRIHNLPPENRVTIFSRWGDKVFEVDGYNAATPGKRFEGKNNDGKALPSGTYFYKIEISAPAGARLVTGYLSLKQ